MRQDLFRRFALLGRAADDDELCSGVPVSYTHLIGALLRQPLCGQCLPAPEHLDGQPQPWADAGSSQADKARQQKGARLPKTPQGELLGLSLIHISRRKA